MQNTIEDAVGASIERHRTRPGGLLPLLHEIQEHLGFVPPDRLGEIAQALNLSRAEVHGVVTFYHHFRTTPPPALRVQVCQAESCQSMGAEALTRHVAAKLGCEMHGRSADGRIGLEPVYCLGLCAQSPALSINDEPHARVTPQRFDRLLAAATRATGR
ncbi:MAG TPA: formate dehydrogenase subunit gamma [Burkholderiaceae bacterium]|nr:formate dehydrogenase subunit gamma [Burkholderiaceae bacterium]